jgi:hypothetical protein
VTTDILNPLGPEDLGKINEALGQLDTAEIAIQKAERAGIDVTAAKEEAVVTREKLQRLKQVYFPND